MESKDSGPRNRRERCWQQSESPPLGSSRTVLSVPNCAALTQNDVWQATTTTTIPMLRATAETTLTTNLRSLPVFQSPNVPQRISQQSLLAKTTMRTSRPKFRPGSLCIPVSHPAPPAPRVSPSMSMGSCHRRKALLLIPNT